MKLYCLALAFALAGFGVVARNVLPDLKPVLSQDPTPTNPCWPEPAGSCGEPNTGGGGGN